MDINKVNKEIALTIADDEAARIYMNSPRATHEFPGKQSVIRYSVAVARTLQDPLSEYANLGLLITSLQLHPHQSYVTKEKLANVS